MSDKQDKIETISINGKEYVPAEHAQIYPNGEQYIIVLDRGWIFQGTLSEDSSGSPILLGAVNVRKWETGGFGGLTKGATSSGAVLDECSPVSFTDPIFMVRVGVKWRES